MLRTVFSFELKTAWHNFWWMKRSGKVFFDSCLWKVNNFAEDYENAENFYYWVLSGFSITDDTTCILHDKKKLLNFSCFPLKAFKLLPPCRIYYKIFLSSALIDFLSVNYKILSQFFLVTKKKFLHTKRVSRGGGGSRNAEKNVTYFLNPA